MIEILKTPRGFPYIRIGGKRIRTACGIDGVQYGVGCSDPKDASLLPIWLDEVIP